jgi:hypothetical protein
MTVQKLRLLRRPVIALVLALMGLSQSCSGRTAAKRAALESEMNEAMDEVRAIVNQPVNPLRRTPEMQVSIYKPGWFHQGASKPAFIAVDVRRTQDTSYGQNEFVTSDLNPGLAWRGSEVEFNPMTKYFYTDRSLPKKRLTEDEMVEINRLYRIIGRCELELAALQR